jgi:hypothetical protein
MKNYFKRVRLGILGILFMLTFNSCQSNNSTLDDEVSNEAPLPPPPTIKTNLTNHKKKFFKELFKDCNLSGDKKSLVTACDFSNEIVRSNANKLAGQNQGQFNLGQVCDIFDYCQSNWKYVNDPKSGDLVQNASFTLSNGLIGDCDDFAVLVCSLVLSIGGEARINYAFNDKNGHAFTEVNIGNIDVTEYISMRYKSKDIDGIWTRTDNSGNKWLNLDWFAEQPGGPYFDYTNGTSFYILQNYCEDFVK